MQGVVKFFNPGRGFGFLRIHPDVPEVFFDARDVIGIVDSGDEVEFFLDDPRVLGRGLVAVEVKRLPEQEISLPSFPGYGRYQDQNRDEKQQQQAPITIDDLRLSRGAANVMDSVKAGSGDCGAGVHPAAVHSDVEATRADAQADAVET